MFYEKEGPVQRTLRRLRAAFCPLPEMELPEELGGEQESTENGSKQASDDEQSRGDTTPIINQ